MKIADSNIQMAGSHASTVRHTRHESLTVWRDGQGSQEEAGRISRARFDAVATRLSVEFASLEVSAEAGSLQPAKSLAEGEEPLAPLDVLKQGVLKLLVEHFTGKKIQLMTPSEIQSGQTPDFQDPSQVSTGEGRQGFGVVYDYYESHYESESTTFSAEGVVRTVDGQEINISIDLTMSREFYSEQSLSLRAGDALKDPLVLNFDGNAAELTERTFSFDIDADGKSDQIAFVGQGSGFLALDRDGDGKVSNGSELFGPTTGNGFAELSAYDYDGNNWIDQNDSIYDRLRIWSRDASGQERLIALGQRGVGAIYLGHIDTPFLLKDTDNEMLGAVRSSGVYLGEDGGVGTVQELDLVV